MYPLISNLNRRRPIRTRIETVYMRRRRPKSECANEDDPLEQGLKPSAICAASRSVCANEDDPLEQGLKHQFRFHQNPGPPGQPG